MEERLALLVPVGDDGVALSPVDRYPESREVDDVLRRSRHRRRPGSGRARRLGLLLGLRPPGVPTSPAIAQPFSLRPAGVKPIWSAKRWRLALSAAVASAPSQTTNVRTHIATVFQRHVSRAHAHACGYVQT